MSKIKTTNKKPFWSDRWGADKICPITYTRLRPGRNRLGIPYSIKLQCGHRFVRSALIEWIKKCPEQTCPVCRKRILLIDLTTDKN